MKTFFKCCWILILIAVIVVGFVSWYHTVTTISSDRYARQFETTYMPQIDDTTGQKEVNMYRVPGYHELLRQRGQLSGLVELAKNDSIGLFLNLPDSVAQMMVKGLAVRDIPIREMGLCSLFGKTSQEALYAWLSEPLRITGSWATIPKEPLNVVQAPKDNTDSIPALTPDTSNAQPVFFILDTDKGLRLYFYQTGGNKDDQKATSGFLMHERWDDIKETVKAMFSFTVPEYKPEIWLGITKEDAKVLYRALPTHGQIVMTL